MLHKDYDRKGSVEKIYIYLWSWPQGAWRQGEPIGGNPPVIKQLDWQKRRQFGNPEEGERPPLEAATKQRNADCDREH
jgi:hypothetical protein